MEKPLKLLIILMVGLGAQERPTGVDFGESAESPALPWVAVPDSLAPAAPESLPVKAVSTGPGFLKRSQVAARSLVITLRVGKRLLGTWLDTLVSSPTRKG